MTPAPRPPGRVLELSSGAEGGAAWCGQLFVRAGYEVVKVELPGAVGELDQAARCYLDAGKTRVADQDAEGVVALAAEAAAVVTDAPPAVVDSWRLLDLPCPVVVSITPYGLDGPMRDWHATAATLLAHGGHTHLMGDPGRAPLTMPGRYPFYQAGNFAFLGAGAALYAAGGAARIEVTALECLATLHQFTDTMWTEFGRLRTRHRNRWVNLHPITLLPCADGWYALNILDNFWAPFAEMIGRADLATDHPWTRNPARMREQDDVERVVSDAIGGWSKRKIFEEGQGTWRVPVGEMQTLGEVLDDPHLEAREFWQHTEGAKIPGSPYRLHPNPNADSGAAQVRKPDPGDPRGRGRPLEGVRVVELAHFWSAPLCGRVLGDLGADVIKVESHDTRGGFSMARMTLDDPDAPPGTWPWNREPLFNKLNRNKRSLAVDLKHPEGRELFLDLVDTADVVLENYSTRALPSLGVGHEILRERNPRLIYAAMPGFGLSGPYASYVALGPSTEPMTGLTALMGYSPDEPRVTAKAILDPMAGTVAAVAIIDALLRRERTGQGGLLEISQHEGGIVYLGEHFVERQQTGVEPEPAANPVYRCAGDDEWIAIGVRSQRDRDALAAMAGIDGDGRDPAALEEFTSRQDKHELAAALQAAGVPAAPVLSAPEWLADSQLEARGYFSYLADADRDPRQGDGLPLCLDGTRGYEHWRRAPTLGEHNAELLRELGLDPAAIDALASAGVIADRPPHLRT